jgi:hypothetical protein
MADGKFITEVVLDRGGGSSSSKHRQAIARNGKKRPHLLRCKTQRPNVDVTSEYIHLLNLGESDKDLVRHLGELGYATTEQVSQMCYTLHKRPIKSAQKRLTQLWERHVLDREPCTGLEKYDIQPQLAYSLGKAGNMILSESDPEGSKKRKPSGKLLMLHNLLLGELLGGLSDFGSKTGWEYEFFGERGAAVQFEYNERRIKMRPDGLLYLNNEEEDIEIPLFIELDTSMRNIDHFRGKVIQYNSYFASNKWKLRFEKFPYVAVVVWGKAEPGEEKKRLRLADIRLQRIIAKVKGDGKWTQGYNWLFARLDHAKRGQFSMLTAKSDKLVKRELFNIPVN